MARRNRDDNVQYCGRLVQEKPYGTTDVCGLPARHTGPHQGKYQGIQWEDNPKGRRHAPKIVKGSRNDPTHGIGADHGNIRGN